jgi:hypothetical protein
VENVTDENAIAGEASQWWNGVKNQAHTWDDAMSPITDKKSVCTNNSYLYHKGRKCHFASASTVCGTEALAEATSASTCKTFSSRVIHKHFSADNLFKVKY